MDKEETLREREKLGANIREMREEQNISLRKFALMVGLSKDYMVAVEHGRKSPTFDTIMKIAGGLGVPPSALMKGIAEPGANSFDDAPDGNLRYGYVKFQ